MKTLFKTHGKLPALAVVALFTLLAAAFAVAQEAPAAKPMASAKANSKVVTTKAASRSGGADPNVKSDSDKNNPNLKAPVPANKGGKTRGAGPLPCGVHVDNRTPWFVRIYVDGDYRGTVNQYGDLVGITGNGPTNVYAVAVFDDGSQKYWGPHVFNCVAGDSYTWRLGE
ncbi:MAG TPA: hypothetical protein VL523_09685 [Terriglobia bacterium]|nr:hypothetical protein [Terriglobia bacterium]